MSWRETSLYLCTASLYLCTASLYLCEERRAKKRNESIPRNELARPVMGTIFLVRDGAELPVGFYSRQLRDAETRYSATELECLAVVEAVGHFELHLHGRPFKVETDHRALELLLSSLNRKLTRWALFLALVKQ